MRSSGGPWVRQRAQSRNVPRRKNANHGVQAQFYAPAHVMNRYETPALLIKMSLGIWKSRPEIENPSVGIRVPRGRQIGGLLAAWAGACAPRQQGCVCPLQQAWPLSGEFFGWGGGRAAETNELEMGAWQQGAVFRRRTLYRECGLPLSLAHAARARQRSHATLHGCQSSARPTVTSTSMFSFFVFYFWWR